MQLNLDLLSQGLILQSLIALVPVEKPSTEKSD